MIHPDSRTLEWIRQVADEAEISQLKKINGLQYGRHRPTHAADLLNTESG
jgi:hypothetical protein